MPEEGVSLKPNDDILTASEIVRLSRLFVSQGVSKIRFTGGEPLVRKDLEEIIRRVRDECGAALKTIAITTNGITLAKKLPSLKAAGVNALNISLDTLISERFTKITRRLGHDRVLLAINTAVDLGYDPVKINCVVMKGVNDEEVLDFVELTRYKPYDVRFIEYMPFTGNNWSDNKFIPYKQLISSIQSKFGPLLRKVDSANETSKSFHLEGFRGCVSFITSMSDHFCNTCNRLRVTADGNLKVCLFGNTEVSLRDQIRKGASNQELLEVIGAAVKRKKEKHAGMYNIAKQPNRPMILIGG